MLLISFVPSSSKIKLLLFLFHYLLLLNLHLVSHATPQLRKEITKKGIKTKKPTTSKLTEKPTKIAHSSKAAKKATAVPSTSPSEVPSYQPSFQPSTQCPDGNYIHDENDLCIDMSNPFELASDLFGGNAHEYTEIFDRSLILDVTSGAPVVPGTVRFSSGSLIELEDLPPMFKVANGIKQELIVEGFYQPLVSGDPIAADLQAQIYFQDGRRESTVVNPLTGFFKFVIFDVPFGVSLFIVIFTSESSMEGRVQGQDEQNLFTTSSTSSSVVCMCINSNPCGPEFALTLEWDQPTSDIDLHVHEPGGVHVYFDSKSGANGAYLDYDDTEGFGPEHYIAPSVFVNSDYLIRVHMFDFDEETAVDINWTLRASSLGKTIWTTSGTFHKDITSVWAEDKTWKFNEQPVCEFSGCDLCSVISNTKTDGSLGVGVSAWITGCDSVSAPSNYKSAYSETGQWEIDNFYCHWIFNGINPAAAASIFNQAAACVVSVLDDTQIARITSKLGNTLNAATAVKAGVEVWTELTPQRDAEEYDCKYHAIALIEVLIPMGFKASVEAAVSYSTSPHTWVEATINDERYILDCFNKIYIKVESSPGCIYSNSDNKVSCTSTNVYALAPVFDFECPTAVPSAALPKGRYYIGPKTQNHGTWRWFNLYMQREKGGIWDYHTKIPAESCRGGFGFHEGPGSTTASDGCISVTNNACFTKVDTFIKSFILKTQSSPRRWQCDGCYFGYCWQGDGVSRMAPIPLYQNVIVLSK